MKHLDFYSKLSIQIAIIFTVIILTSFIPDQWHGFFGDWLCGGSIKGNGCPQGYNHIPEWHWGYRHFMWFLMGLCLFAVQITRLIIFIKKSN